MVRACFFHFAGAALDGAVDALTMTPGSHSNGRQNFSLAFRRWVSIQVIPATVAQPPQWPST